MQRWVGLGGVAPASVVCRRPCSSSRKPEVTRLGAGDAGRDSVGVASEASEPSPHALTGMPREESMTCRRRGCRSMGCGGGGAWDGGGHGMWGGMGCVVAWDVGGHEMWGGMGCGGAWDVGGQGMWGGGGDGLRVLLWGGGGGCVEGEPLERGGVSGDGEGVQGASGTNELRARGRVGLAGVTCGTESGPK